MGTILHYGWKQVSIITQVEPIFIKVCIILLIIIMFVYIHFLSNFQNKEVITTLLKAENITVLESEDILTNEDPATKNGIFVCDIK